MQLRVFRHKTDGRIIKIPAGKTGSFRLACRKLSNYIAYNFRKKYAVHVVLDLAVASPELHFKELNRVITFIRTRLSRSGADFKYIAVKEIQKKRFVKYGEAALHYHVLCVYDKPYQFPSPEDIGKSWGLGRCKIVPAKLRYKAQDITRYIGKYIGKGFEENPEWEFKKQFTASQIGSVYKLSMKKLSDLRQKWGVYSWKSYKATFRKVFMIDCRGEEKIIMQWDSEWIHWGIEKPSSQAWEGILKLTEA